MRAWILHVPPALISIMKMLLQVYAFHRPSVVHPWSSHGVTHPDSKLNTKAKSPQRKGSDDPLVKIIAALKANTLYIQSLSLSLKSQSVILGE